MLDKHLILGVFDNPDGVLNSVTKLRKKGYEVFDCYTPFPVHGLDTALGIKRSNLTVGAFICGAIGFSLGLLLQFYIMVWDWPMIIGGKPDTYKMLPSMVPVTFEVTVLCTAFGMGILFFTRTKMIHGIKPDIIDPRQTDDRLFVAIEGKAGLNVAEISEIFQNEGALELRERNGNLLGDDTALEETTSTENEVQEMSEEEVSAKKDLLLNVVGASDQGQKDDLKKISGVGPKYEEKLNAIGIYTYKQVANLNNEAIQALEALTKYFPGRIEREDWVGQAKQLMEQSDKND